MTTQDLEAGLKLIAAHASALRKAGVTGRVKVGDVEFDLATAEPAAEPLVPSTTTTDRPDDILKDPLTYGGTMPRRRGARPTDEDEAHGDRRALVESP
jgi:hypothetical protein